MSALVVGEALIDYLPGQEGGGQPGGSPANVAVALGRLDRPVSLLTRLGEDTAGHRIASWLAESGVQLAVGAEHRGRTSTAAARLGPDGDVAYDFDLTWDIRPDAAIPDGVTVMHTGSVAATLAPGAGGVARLARLARPAATISYDPNVRPSLMGAPGSARPVIEELVGIADVVKVSEADLAWLYPGCRPVTLAHAWLELGPALVVVTRGGDGATGVCRAGEVSLDAPSVKVVDPVGAGDSFMGALIDGLWSVGLLGADQRDRLREIKPATVTAVLRHSVQAAAITVSRAGANLPFRRELPTRVRRGWGRSHGPSSER